MAAPAVGTHPRWRATSTRVPDRGNKLSTNTTDLVRLLSLGGGVFPTVTSVVGLKYSRCSRLCTVKNSVHLDELVPLFDYESICKPWRQRALRDPIRIESNLQANDPHNRRKARLWYKRSGFAVIPCVSFVTTIKTHRSFPLINLCVYTLDAVLCLPRT